MSSKRNFKTVLAEYGFTYNKKQELWVLKSGFGRKSTVDYLLMSLFTIYKGKEKVFDYFVDSLDHFEAIMAKHFSK
jgi:hypothetical protein